MAMTKAEKAEMEALRTKLALRWSGERPKLLPLPAASRRRGRPPTFPWRDMEVGDSFAVPRVDLQTVIRVSRAAHHALNRLGRTVVCRTRTENGERVVRVWRVE